jgi:hypothetical protein
MALAVSALPAMQRPPAPNLPLTQENLAIFNQSNQDAIPMDISSDTSSVSTEPPNLDYDPVKEAALMAQLAALDEHTWRTH